MIDLKKVGIITFQNAINYGAVLQAFALQEKFKEQSKLTHIINYQSEYFRSLYGFQKNFSTKNKIKFILFFIIKNFYFFIKKIKFNIFAKKYLNLSKKYNKNNIKKINSMYDCIVTGSDQVFNLKLTNGDYTYYLDFCDSKKRCSYAASFGNYDLSSLKDIAIIFLKSFAHLSLREIDAARLMKKKYNIIAECSLDPTLLYTGVEWEKKLQLKRFSQHTIFYYKVAEPNKLSSYVVNFAEEKHLSVVEVTSDLKKQIRGSKALRTCSPTNFISNIYNCEYIATTSFHATVFGILFHKKMIIELYDKSGKFNNRIYYLLTLLNIDVVNTKDVQLIDKVDWQSVERKLAKERKKSIDFISKILN